MTLLTAIMIPVMVFIILVAIVRLPSALGYVASHVRTRQFAARTGIAPGDMVRVRNDRSGTVLMYDGFDRSGKARCVLVERTSTTVKRIEPMLLERADEHDRERSTEG